MGIWDDFQPERRADWEDIARAIHDTVTMDGAVRMYLPALTPRHNRIPCPFHNGKDYNLSYNTHGYKCFVCGASGDVIGFVKEACELSTRSDAMKRINNDFNLHLPIDGEADIAFSVEAQKRRREAEKKKEAEQAWEDEYQRLTDEWIRLDTIKRTADPSSEEYADAVKNIDFVGFQLDMLLCDKR